MIHYENGRFVIETASSSYVFVLNEEGTPINVYYGRKLAHPEEIALPPKSCVNIPAESHVFTKTPEYPVTVRAFYGEPCLTARFPDGVVDLELTYDSHEIKGDLLTVTLKDTVYKIKVRLFYKVFEGEDIIDKHVEVENCGEESITLTEFMSGAIYLPHSEKYVLMHDYGEWANEYRKEILPVPHGKTVFENRRGVCSGPHMVPFFAVGTEGVTETSGEVRYGFLHYDGNFKIVCEQNSGNAICVMAGISDYATEIVLSRGEKVVLPVITTGYSDRGFERMSVSLYDYQFDYLLPKRPDRTMPIIYNSWYPFEFDIDEEKCIALLDKVADMGAELFVIDDGWFGNRVDDRRSLGDWYDDPRRFPHGIRAVSDAAHARGLKFGLWMEPEMVNPESGLFEKHPEWVVKYPTRENIKQRNQYVLDLSRDDVREFVWETADRLVEKNALDYLKWDMNRYISEVNTDVKDFFVRVANNVSEVWRRLNEKYPALLLECCAHGGARTDYGMLPYCDRINRSDNSDPIDMLRLHEGFSTFVVPRLAGGAGNVPLEDHPLNGRKSPLKYRVHLGMTGSMSIGMDLLTMSDETMNELKAYIAEFKQMRPALHNSYVYRLQSAYDEKTYAVWEYLERNGNSAYVFVFGHGVTRFDRRPRLKLRGLDPAALYNADGKLLHGDVLMQYGLDVQPHGDWYSRIIKIVREDRK